MSSRPDESQTTEQPIPETITECEQSKYDCLTQPLSRRKLLKGTAATAGTAALTSAVGSDVGAASAVSGATCSMNPSADAMDESESSLNGGAVSPGNFEKPGHPPRSAYRSLAETERRYRDEFPQQAQGGSEASGNSSATGDRPKPQFDKVVNAVDDLGVDPTGQESVVGPITDAAEDGTLIVLPKESKLLLDRDLMFNVNGTLGMVGAGYESAEEPPGEKGARFIAPEGKQVKIRTGPVQSGLFGNFVLDMSSTESSVGIFPEAETFCYARDIRIIGVQDNTGSEKAQEENYPSCTPVTRNQDAAVRVQRLYTETSGIAGMKNKGGSPGFWVGRENKGLTELVQCQSMNKADNGIYGSRTPGDLHIIDGAYINNAVSQIRFAGKGSWAANGVSLLIDIEQFNGPNPEEFNNSGIATNGVKTEMPSHINKAGGGKLKNVEIVVRSARDFGYPIAVRSHSGALTVEKTRVVNELDTPWINASAPGGGGGQPQSKPPFGIKIKNTTFTGTHSSPVVNIQGRPSSSIAETCLKMKGASPGDIEGQITERNVTYGPECKGTGAPDVIEGAADAAGDVYDGAAGFVSDVVGGLFEGAAVIATLPFIIIIVVALLAFFFGSSLLAAIAFMGGAVKYLSKKED